MNDMEIEKIKIATIKSLKKIIDELEDIRIEGKLSYKFNTKDLNNNQFIDNLLNEIKNKTNHKKYKYIYTFHLSENSNLDEVYTNYKYCKENKKFERAYARLNNKSHCLYVGSSKGLVPRIKQHLGFGPKGTYAMQIYYWCEDLYLDIVINLYAFVSDIDPRAFQAFEDGAWNFYRPMLGRQGKR